MTVRLGVLEHWFDGEPVVPGCTLAERLASLEEAGYQGIQLSAVSQREGMDAIRDALAGSSIRLLIFGRHGQILSGDPDIRAQAVADISAGLKDAAELGAVGSILVPIRVKPEIAPPNPPSFGVHPMKSLIELEKEILVEQLRRIAPAAEAAGVPVILEPLNRYETHLIKSLDDAAEICRAVGSPGIKMMGDFFHMNLEDDDMEAAIERNADCLAYIHLADSGRYQPGTGHLDFTPGFRALKRIGYDGYMTIEAKIKGEATIDALRASADYIRKTWEAARSGGTSTIIRNGRPDEA
jgi:sugar phosphate isomerase/epimerase